MMNIGMGLWAIAVEPEFLAASYEDYTTHVSTPDMAVSKRVAELLVKLFILLRPERVLDFGSGYSSFVFRYCRAILDTKTEIITVDDDREWLNKTQVMLSDYDLLWSEDRCCLLDDYLRLYKTLLPSDLVFYDLGRMHTRRRYVDLAFARTSNDGVIVFDDLHKRGYLGVVGSSAEKHGWGFTTLREDTLDTFGRYAGIAERIR